MSRLKVGPFGTVLHKEIISTKFVFYKSTIGGVSQLKVGPFGTVLHKEIISMKVVCYKLTIGVEVLVTAPRG